MFKKRLLATVATGSMALAVLALPSSMSTFQKLYDVKPGSHLATSRCLVCHTTSHGGKLLNPYGKDVQKAMREAKSHKVTDKILKDVELLDSTGKGGTNLSRIKADKLPGGN